MSVTAANKTAVLNYVREKSINIPAGGRIDEGSKEVKDIAKGLGMSRTAVAEALSGFDPSAPVDHSSITGTPKENFEALVPKDGSIHTEKYNEIADAFKDLGKDNQKAEIKWVESKNQPGLAQYLKDVTHSDNGFLSSLGNAIGEALFGGHR